MSTKKNLLAIINPISGTHSKFDIPVLIKEILKESLFNIDIKFTQYAGHATLLAEEAVKEGVDYVLSVGGDGTCNEIAKSLIHSSAVLGIIPIGSGNGLARHLGIPLDVSRALKIINEERVESLDYCKANDQVFFCTCGVGFDALVSLKFSEDKHRGGVTYVRKVISEYMKYKLETYELIIDGGKIREKAFLIACGNASQYGNNAYIAPHANMQDGLMDITVIRPFTPLDIGPMAVQLFTKQINRNSNIRYFEKKSISIIREKPGVMHIDGEPIQMDTRIDISCIAGGLKVLVPVPDNRKSIIEPIQNVFLEVVDTIKAELNI